MMTIKTNLDTLKKKDIYSLMLFVLYKFKDVPQYSTLSELTYVLDTNNLLRLCELYGGTTITIPTIQEMEEILNALLLYQKVNLEHKDMNEVLESFQLTLNEKRKLLKIYEELCEVLKNYTFSGEQNV